MGSRVGRRRDSVVRMPGPLRSADRSVAGYLAHMRRWRFPPEGDLGESADWQHYQGWRRVLLSVVPEPLIARGRVVLTQVRMLAFRRATHPTADVLRLHLGCGERQIPGWVNVDLAGARADLVWDLRRPLPMPPGSVAAIFHEHFLEHLELPDAVDSLRQCHGLLAPGGVLRIGVPDFRQHVRSYLEADGFLEEIRPGRPVPLFALNELVYSYGHRSLWDADAFRLVLSEIGFEQVQVMDFGESEIAPAPDSPERQQGTLYVEALKSPG